jgi:transglutaminase-like putative cysteine protease
MTDFYMRSVSSNLAHLRTLTPAQPKRNLASNGATLPLTEEDDFLNPQIRWSNIPEGKAGTRSTMQTMAQLARQAAQDPEFIKFMRQFSGVSDFEEWVRDHFVYRDEQQELIRTPIFMLEDMGRTSGTHVVGLEGDCDDIATFISAGICVLGLPARLVAIRHDQNDPNFQHVFAQANESGQWITLDPTIDTDTTMQSLEDMIVPV